jgi:hypothetical protein
MDNSPKSSAHSPGSWYVVCASDNDGEAYVIESDLRTIAWTANSLAEDGSQYNSDEDKANAYLIAAAPDLLEACKAALAVGNDYVAIQKLKAAIAKTGSELSSVREWFTLNTDDIQNVAEENIDRTLTPEEIERVIDGAKYCIPWEEVISDSITAANIK